ncbi:MAG: hypothetical protein U0326_13640 [Polyangiales bacterium]
MAAPPLRPLLVAAMDAQFRGVAAKVLRDGSLRFEGAGYGLTVLSSVRAGQYPLLEFVASAHLDHVGDLLARVLDRKGAAQRDISLHFGHHEMFTRWGPAYGATLGRRGPAELEVMGDDYVGLHVAHLRAILEGEVLPLTRRCAELAAYDALLNEAPESPLPYLRLPERAARGLAARHLLGGHDLAALAARYDRALAEVYPLARAEYDAVRRRVAPL